jgi:subtilisin family serine protease
MPELDHLRWQKLQFPPATYKKPKGYGSAPPLRDRATHSAALRADMESAIETTQAEREALGLNPSQMLVLEFTALLDLKVREYLEGHLGLHILSETAVERELSQEIFSVEVTAPERQRAARMIGALNQVQHQIVGTEPGRASSGEMDARKAKFIFHSRAAATLFIINIKRAPAWNGWKLSTVDSKKRETLFKTLVHFPTDYSIAQLRAQLAAYAANATTTHILTPIQRATLFDAFQRIGIVSAEDRLGAQATEQGFPEGIFYFDVDLWHTGENADQEKRDARMAIEQAGGRVSDIKAVADMLILMRVQGTEETARKLLRYDRVSRLDLPPTLPPQSFDVLDTTYRPTTPVFGDDMPMACVMDSGVLPGHPLLAGGVIDSHDFDSGENTAADRAGHGTHVAGIVVYGNLVKAISQNRWVPKVQVLNAKIMRKATLGGTDFADAKRVETQLEDAIRWAAGQGCRTFNLSIGDISRTYSGHQLPWALLLDTLARELDIVIVVATGNNTSPEVPVSATRAQLQKGVLENLYGPDHSLIDPATAALALTVGAVARQDQPETRPLVLHPGEVHPPVASPVEGPSPFTRTGVCDGRRGGLHRSIKPELVAYGGNYLLRLSAPPYEWAKNDRYLGEPSLAFNFPATGMLFASASGTSFAAPYVTHIAAQVEHRFKQGGRPASANLVRALVVNSAKHSEAARSFIEGHRTADAELSILRTMGYGKPDPKAALYSSENRVVLYAEDAVPEDQYHLYELALPADFVRENGRRRIRLTLAYDPPIRGSRKEYLARTMWFELFRDASAADIQRANAGTLGRSLTSESLALTPKTGRMEWSTVQSASFEIRRSSTLETEAGTRLFHVLVGCQQRFKSGEDPLQSYALVATLEHEKNDVQLYEAVKTQLQVQQARSRARLRA